MRDDFLLAVLNAANEYDMLTHGDAVAVALSGGADSVSLLLALKALESELGISVSACHVNHNLRGAESDGDMHFCEELCSRLGVTLRVASIDVRSAQQKHESLEECARRLRYDFFESVCNELGENAKIATAHNANDNAETVILNLCRGTGLKGLCGIPPVRGRFIRPLINCTRADVESFLKEAGESYVIDSTNLCDDYTRNKIRHIILPEMEKINGSLLTAFSRMDSTLRADNDYLEELAQQALLEAKSGRGYDAMLLHQLPLPIKSRAIKRILSDGGIEPSALRINTALSLLIKRSARFNPCRDRFFTIRKGVCFVETIEQHYKKHEKNSGE